HKFDPETKHTLLQYAAAMIDRILSMAGNPPPRFAKIEIPPHPVHKVEHLRRWFGDRVIEAESRGITVLIEDRVMERAFSKVARDRLGPRALDSGASLRGGETFSDSVKAFLNLMVENDEALNMKRVVAAAGMSSRTFQRQLKEEGTSFSYCWPMYGAAKRSSGLRSETSQSRPSRPILAIPIRPPSRARSGDGREFRQVGSARRRVE